MKFLLILALFLGAHIAYAQNDKYVVQDDDYNFEVTLDKDQSQAQVKVLNAKKKLPKFMDLIIYRSKKKPLTVAVRAVDLKDPSSTYTGDLAFGQESYTGLALQWNFDFKKIKLKGKKK